jgi:hypothetical protein
VVVLSARVVVVVLSEGFQPIQLEIATQEI